MKRRGNRITETSAVSAVRNFFESNGCIYQSVEAANDYGKDAYIDLAEGEYITGLCAALQIKGGVFYRRADGFYSIPLNQQHAKIWRESTLPILGLVTISKLRDRLPSSVQPLSKEAPMSENVTQEKPLPTIWRVPDELWEIIEPILAEHDPPKSTGRDPAWISEPPWTRSSSG